MIAIAFAAELNDMPKYLVPENTGKVRVVKGMGGLWAVWNGKTDIKHEFRILTRTRKAAEAAAKLINSKQHGGEIEIWEQ